MEVKKSSSERDIPYLLSLTPLETESRKVLIAGVAHNLSHQITQRNKIQSAYEELRAVHLQLEELNDDLEDKVAERTATLEDAYSRLEEQNKSLQELDQLKSDFVSMVSHELRNPLNNLGGGLELMLARTRRRVKDKNTLGLMQNEVRRLTRFVESILNVSAIEAGSLKLDIAPLSLDLVFENIIQYWGSSENVERIKVELQPGLPKVRAAKNALESILRHLVDNALKYAPDGSVIVSVKQQKRQVIIDVRDFGPGIPEEKQSLLFGRFQRLDVKDSQSVYGYGLGLYLSQRMLEQMDSTLTFEAPSDGGARFSFKLKVAKNE
ncbi:MAG: HAMP domain-containing histidine kinase [Anaerolineae bacterium]|nr:HAMP domain-containing histidine kinase [Anaerolineae bacterium]